jgi:hypothetical protein
MDGMNGFFVALFEKKSTDLQNISTNEDRISNNDGDNPSDNQLRKRFRKAWKPISKRMRF